VENNCTVDTENNEITCIVDSIEWWWEIWLIQYPKLLYCYLVLS
jgi:hypothetical protein